MTMISFSSSRLKGGTVQRPAFQAALRSPPLTCGSKSERTVMMTRWMRGLVVDDLAQPPQERLPVRRRRCTG